MLLEYIFASWVKANHKIQKNPFHMIRVHLIFIFHKPSRDCVDLPYLVKMNFSLKRVKNLKNERSQRQRSNMWPLSLVQIPFLCHNKDKAAKKLLLYKCLEMIRENLKYLKHSWYDGTQEKTWLVRKRVSHLMLDSHHVFRSITTELPVLGSRESENKHWGRKRRKNRNEWDPSVRILQTSGRKCRICESQAASFILDLMWFFCQDNERHLKSDHCKSTKGWELKNLHR